MDSSKVIHEVLPLEILSLIFSFINPLESTNKHIPITLSRVCRFWRSIALGTPFLWTCVRIQVKERPITKDTIDAALLWFRRTKDSNHLRHLLLEFPRSVALKSDRDALDTIVLDLIQPIALWLGTLVLRIPLNYLRSLLKLSPFQLPQLQTLVIRSSNDDNSLLSGFLSGIPRTAFSKCTMLRRLELQAPTGLGILQRPDPASINLTLFQYDKLTSLTLLDRGIHVSVFLQIFRLATNLQHCEFLIYATASIHQISNTSATTDFITHPYLKSFKVVFSGGPIAPFFNALNTDLPMLEDLRIEATYGANNIDCGSMIKALISYQKRHQFGIEMTNGLRRFEMKNLQFGDDDVTGNIDDLVNFLRRNSGIETLLLEGCVLFREEFISKLVAGDRNQQSKMVEDKINNPITSGLDLPGSSEGHDISSSLLPNLQNIFIKDESSFAFLLWPSTQLVVDFLRSRWDIDVIRHIGNNEGASINASGTGVAEDEDRVDLNGRSNVTKLRKVVISEKWGAMAYGPDAPGWMSELTRLKKEGLKLSLSMFKDALDAENRRQAVKKWTWDEKADWIDID